MRLFRYISFVIFFFSCQITSQYISKPTKSLLHPDFDLLELNLKPFHLNDSITTVYLELKNENILYKHTDTSLSFYAELKISFKLLIDQYDKKIIDSASYFIIDRSLNEKFELKSLFSKFNIKAKRNNYYLITEVIDLNKKVRYSKGCNILKKKNLTSQNFLILKNNKISFKNIFFKNEKLDVYVSNNNISEINVDCILKSFAPAQSPFNLEQIDEFKAWPDSTFQLKSQNNKFVLTTPSTGFYYIKPDLLSEEGLTLFTFDKSFPGITDVDEMINCTQYIMSKDEIKRISNANDKKATIDKYWLELGGSKDRAKELLKHYYTRVKESNKYYTSYKEGWKSDRGMIFIVFGYPTNRYLSINEETWVYGDETNPGALRFVFKKNNNIFTDNDYVLERFQFYKLAWQNAVNIWRQDHVYIENGK